MRSEMSLEMLLCQEHRVIDQGFRDYVDSVDMGTPDTAPLQEAVRALRRHIYVEEAFVFPPLRSGGLMAAIYVMFRQHGEMWPLLDTLMGLAEAEQHIEARAQVRVLETMLASHNGKEEPIIYPQMQSGLPTPDYEAARQFLDDGELPLGWQPLRT